VGADPNGARWPRLLKELAPTLPGDWDICGGRGAKALLIRQPVRWTFTWIGLHRIRVADDPYLMVGLVPTVEPFSLNLTYGQRSDGGGPGTFDLVADDVTAAIRRYLLDDALPDLDTWTEPFLAQIAEASLTLSDAERVPAPHFLQAAGWRVINDTGSPVQPAEESIAFYRERDATEEAAWYQSLIDAWHQGGRATALSYLEEQRLDGLRRLKILPP
jgi:hypothetical protein